MATIPLVALQSKTPDILGDYGKVMQLKSLGQQQQLQRQQIQENNIAIQNRQAGMKAMQQWDGKDQSQLPDLIRQNGGDLKTVMDARQAIVKQQTDTAAMNKAQLDVSATKNNYILGKLQAATDPKVPDEQLPQSVLQAAQSAVQDGYLDPQHAQMIQQMTQQYASDPAGLRSHLQIFEKSLQSQSEQFAQAQKERETAASEQTAGARATEANTNAQKFQAELPGGPLNKVTQDIAIGTNPQIQAGKVAVATAEGEARANVEARMARGSNAALANVPPHLVAPATADATKADQQFTQAQQAGNEMQSMVDLAKGGNKVAYAYSPVTGVLQINVAGQIKRMNMPEIESYGAAGSALDRIKGFIGKQASGASIPEGILNDMQSVSQMVTKGAQDKYQQDIKGINSWYGAKFEPMAGGAPGGGGQTSSKAALPAKVLSMAQIQQAAKDHNVSVDEATKQAKAAGYSVQ